MLYKPNFCCNCGEKIERTDWNLLTSRRFCEACAAENKRHDCLPQLTVAGGLLAVMFGIGTLFGGGREQPAPVHTLNASPALLKPEAPAARSVDKSEAPQAAPASPKSLTQSTGEQVSQSAAVTEAPAKTYYCGALTKKGTPCSRKVKAAGSRCYQHEGKQTGPGA